MNGELIEVFQSDHALKRLILRGKEVKQNRIVLTPANMIPVKLILTAEAVYYGELSTPKRLIDKEVFEMKGNVKLFVPILNHIIDSSIVSA